MKQEEFYPKSCADCKGIVCVQLEDRRIVGNLRTNQVTEMSLPIRKCPYRRDFRARDWEDFNNHER